MKCGQLSVLGILKELIFIQNGALLHFAIVVREWRDGVVVRASASQSIDLGFISQIELYQKTLKNGIHSFPAWHSANKE